MGVCPGSVRLPYLLRLVEIGHNSRIGIGPVQFLLDEEFPGPGRYHRGEHVDELRSDDAPVSLGPHGGQGDYVLVEPEEGLDLPSSVVHEVDVPGIEVLIRNEADGSESGLLLSERLAVIGILLLRIGGIAPAPVGGIEAAPVAVVIKAVLALLGGLNHVAPVPEGLSTASISGGMGMSGSPLYRVLPLCRTVFKGKPALSKEIFRLFGIEKDIILTCRGQCPDSYRGYAEVFLFHFMKKNKGTRRRRKTRLKG